MKTGATAVLLVVLSGCATSPGQRELLAAAPLAELTDVPFFAQDDYQCGPAALATVLAHSGVDVTPDQLVSHIFVPKRRGSLQAELLAAARSHGRVPYLLPGAPASMLEEVRAGRPVLLLQNLGVKRLPIWHYAVLVGFDSEEQEFLLRSGTVERHKVHARRFLASWQRAERWAIAVVPASTPPGSADALGWLRAVAPFESTGNLAIAAEGYEAGVKRWPDDPLVWTALGNVRYLQQDLVTAEQAYVQALSLSPEHWTARNNLVRTLIARGCPDLAQQWIHDAGTPPAAFAPTWNGTLDDLAAADGSRCST